jgi:thiamine transport system substrate-binding protein
MILAALVIFFSTLNSTVLADELKIYTYDALCGKGTLGELLSKEFHSKTRHTLALSCFGSVGEALNQIQIEGQSTKADLLLGVDTGFSDRARTTGLFAQIPGRFFSGIKTEAQLGTDNLFLPFDYGYLSFIYQKTRNNKSSWNLERLTLSEFLTSGEINKKIVVEDPRTSSIGFLFLRWTQKIFKREADLKSMWSQLIPKLVTLAPSWTGAYGLFLKNEADWVLSYTSSRAYHLEKEKNNSYEALVFADGNAVQVEGVAVLKSSKKEKLINLFLDQLTSRDIQSQIPFTQWMYPVLKDTKLPISFQKLKVPKPIVLSSTLTEDDRKKMIQNWTQWAISAP